MDQVNSSEGGEKWSSSIIILKAELTDSMQGVRERSTQATEGRIAVGYTWRGLRI